MTDKVYCHHPDSSKKGINIDLEKYHSVKNAILDSISEVGKIKFMDLSKAVQKKIPGFKGSINWYMVTVKLDLESRGMIKRVTKASPQVLSLK